ncbi:MAG TPA: amidohydrolase [Longimicrobiales bacterium]|nr:amidohydrolase [Longimicrobiales bacterium]
MTSLLHEARALESELIAVRRDLHRHPELAFHEERTAGVAAAAAAALGWRVRTGIARTGVVAELGSGPPVIALRADMDALPIQESGTAEYRSTVPGVMHACGHDAHVAMLLGAARLLAARQQRGTLPPGTVRLLFQPSEEASDEDGKSGATRLVEAGAMRDVAAVFGLHVGAHLESGTAFISPGPVMAGSDLFRATVRGRSSHAARPQEGVDAIVLAAHCVLACQNAVARRLAPGDQGVLTIGTIQGGFAENVLAESVALQGTIRYFEESVRTVLQTELRRAFDVAAALGGATDLELRPGYPPVRNDAAAAALAARAVGAALGADAVRPFEPMMTAEDFAILAREAPGCFFWFGAALDPPREHHHPAFDIDERTLPRGAAALAACALQGLAEFT